MIDFVVACRVADIKHPLPYNPRGTQQFTYLDVLEAVGQPRTEAVQRDLNEQDFKGRMAVHARWERALLALEVYPKW